ncbi:MAG: hypothetical protein HKP58_04340 [Desulfatitalea sp.]|nr:hypothetical protein [Desulfatitalea sp.]NNJ99620.1 hypothetical protein [Desulfatitalea sp.]
MRVTRKVWLFTLFISLMTSSAALSDRQLEAVSYKITDQDLKTLQQAKEPEATQLPESLITALTPLQNIEYAMVDLFDNAVEQQLKTAGLPVDVYSGDQKTLIQHTAQKTHGMDDLAAIQWKSGGCGCVQDFTRVVYGFYPYWMGSDKKVDQPQNKKPENQSEKKDTPKETQTINFSLLSRIAYFAVYLDQTGRLQEHTPWRQEKHQAEFIKIAHKYRTKVDLVIHHPDWRTWYQTAMARESGMIKELVRLVTTCPMVDGVTLYFEAYPEKDAYAEKFKTLLDNLQTAFQKTEKPFSINVMMPAMSEKNQNAVRLFLSHVFPETHEDTQTNDPVDLLIVFLEQPTTYTKKEMRYAIEKEFKGYQRRNVLRKIVPVITPPVDPENQQFKDDLIYFENNFGGAGFWPLPAGGAGTVKQIAASVLSMFRKNEDYQILQIMLQNHSAGFCNWICPNRNLLKMIFWAFLLFLGVCGLGSTWICELRAFRKKYNGYFLGILLLDAAILISLLTCDPDLMNHSTEIFIILMIVLTFYMVFRQVRKMRQAGYP